MNFLWLLWYSPFVHWRKLHHKHGRRRWKRTAIFSYFRFSCHLHNPRWMHLAFKLPFKVVRLRKSSGGHKQVWYAHDQSAADISQIARFMGQHGAHLGPVGPRWAPCWPHEPCYQGMLIGQVWKYGNQPCTATIILTMTSLIDKSSLVQVIALCRQTTIISVTNENQVTRRLDISLGLNEFGYQ